MWSVPPSDTVLHLLSYVALTAQAMTAALTAGRRSMDWAGVCMLGCITALGGGTIRDVLLGHYPPLQRRAAAVSRRTLCQRLRRDRLVLRHRLRAQPQ